MRLRGVTVARLNDLLVPCCQWLGDDLPNRARWWRVVRERREVDEFASSLYPNFSADTSGPQPVPLER